MHQNIELRPDRDEFYEEEENHMRELYSKATRVVTLWVIILGGMAVMTATSAVVLAAGQTRPPVACSGACQLQGDCTSGCNCLGEGNPGGGSCKPNH
jgi:hypothetical protein